ncbi:CoA transferase [Neobacillus sp. OS1-2]|uniref:CaiB/BaiF CoA transferase family protein n=1 Tax=Neobacillus sp. OS1-2 TaxID=3070680 RepID=UPI0027E1A1D7|nr:CoA transferase [Neobacillus sp. OS1-2]WML39598.1 CoA transferase [Neobacillus sp. OS1-2]
MSENNILQGIRVIDASTVLAAPLIANLLGDFGAEVIKIEQPGKGDQTRHFGEGTWKVTNRNKKAITLDFNQEKGVQLYYQLVSKADVVITNFRPETLRRWNIDYEDLVKVKENLVMIHFSAFGRNGPYAEKPGFARVAESFSGLTYMTGYPDRKPIFSGYPIADAMGGVYGAFSVMLALYHYKQTGEGQLIDLSLYEPLVRVMENYIVDYDLEGKIPERRGTFNPVVAPNDLYDTKDHKWIVIPASTQNIFERLMTAIGHPELVNDPRFLTNQLRVRNRDELDDYLHSFFSEHTLEYSRERLEKHGVAYSTVNSVADLYHDPHVQERENIISVFDYALNKDIKMQGIVPKFSKTPGQVKWAGAPLGWHNNEIYQGLLNLSDDDFHHLVQLGVI